MLLILLVAISGVAPIRLHSLGSSVCTGFEKSPASSAGSRLTSHKAQAQGRKLLMANPSSVTLGKSKICQ